MSTLLQFVVSGVYILFITVTTIDLITPLTAIHTIMDSLHRRPRHTAHLHRRRYIRRSIRNRRDPLNISKPGPSLDLLVRVVAAVVVVVVVVIEPPHEVQHLRDAE